MKYQKGKLVKLLKLIEEILNEPENEWMRFELARIAGARNADISKVNEDSLEGKINLIQEYLHIDYDSIIDYKDFDLIIRDQLTRDCIEMIRFHKETPNHKKNFEEFCRYAHLQVEEMLNYFYIKKFKDFAEVIKIIMTYNEKYKPKSFPKLIEQVPFLTKIIAFQAFTKPEYTLSLHNNIVFLNDMRNEFSHRSSLTRKEDEEELSKFQFHYPNYKKGDTIDFKSVDASLKEIFNKGLYIIKKREQDFSLIYKSLNDFKKVILLCLESGKIIDAKSSIGYANPILNQIKDKLKNE